MNVKSQERYEKELETMSEQLHEQLISKGIKYRLGTDSLFYKVAIVDISNEDDKHTKLTELLEDEIAVDLAVKSNGVYTVLDRNYISKLLEEKNMPKSFGNKRDFAQNLGRIKAANLMIVGKLTNFDNEFRIIFTILETKEGSTVSGAKGKITASELLKAKNNDKSTSNEESKKTDYAQAATKSTSAPQVNDRSINIDDMKNMDPNCASKRTGTILIENWSNYKLSYTFQGLDQNGRQIQIDAIVNKQESNPVMGLPEGTFGYYCYAYTDGGSIVQTTSSTYSSGTLTVVKCKETTLRAK